MIFQQEKTLQTGTLFKFKTQPIDPNDPFRGKYVVLNYAANVVDLDSKQSWAYGEGVYARIVEGTDGFAKIGSLEKFPPIGDTHYVKVEIANIFGENPLQARINFPFSRFYMEEHKAPKAEALMRELSRDSSKVFYSLVFVHKGKAALEDVMLGDISLKEAVMEIE